MSLDFPPSITKETAEAGRDTDSQVFAMCNTLQTVCEQSASVLGSAQGVHQFVIEVHRIATFAALKTSPRQPKKGVVEHKGNVLRLVCFSGASAGL